jgi:catechol 2,3-dioxygenase-like lactoylglutathione lyase family enzyme
MPPKKKKASRNRNPAAGLEFNHAMIYTRDASRAVDFYSGKLGFKMIDEFRHEGFLVYARLRAPRGNSTIALHILEPGNTVPEYEGVRLYFEVKNLEAFCKSLEAAGRRVRLTAQAPAMGMDARLPQRSRWPRTQPLLGRFQTLPPHHHQVLTLPREICSLPALVRFGSNRHRGILMRFACGIRALDLDASLEVRAVLDADSRRPDIADHRTVLLDFHPVARPKVSGHLPVHHHFPRSDFRAELTRTPHRQPLPVHRYRAFHFAVNLQIFFSRDSALHLDAGAKTRKIARRW